MKRYLILCMLAAVAILPSCMKGESMDDSDYVGGRETYYNRKAHNYMMAIADDLVAGSLDELELALEIDSRGSGRSAHFNIGGPLGTVGSTWTVKAEDSVFKGLSIRCSGEEAWTLEFSGDFALVSEENLFPTVLSVHASRFRDPESEGEGWAVVLDGSRTERLEYRCSFDSPSLVYLNTRGAGTTGWNQMFGDLNMSVFKGADEIDACCLSAAQP